MNQSSEAEHRPETSVCFFDHPGVQVEEIPVGPGMPLGIQRIANPQVGMAGVYGTWGRPYDNQALPELVEARTGTPLTESERLNLAELGFLCRHHVQGLTDPEHVDLEVAVGARMLAEAAHANGWETGDVDAVLLGISIPACRDYVERIAGAAGIPGDALKVSIHKACDGSVAGLNLALNPNIPTQRQLPANLAELLDGKKVLVGGIEGLSRAMRAARDKQALQIFGNGAGILGFIPGKTIKFLTGGMHEVYDAAGLLQVRMEYPHSRATAEGKLIEVTEIGPHSLRVAGLMHEPATQADPVLMAGPMGMVKLFVRSGVVAVRNVYQAYTQLMADRGMAGHEFAVAIVHHANYKINQLKDSQLRKEGICIPMPWLLSEFGNVSAASNMIAFLRRLASMVPGDHVLVDGFGAGTYYDVLAIEMGEALTA
jgi:3-oxoacyl-[acyl-carrier-protein] synthase III